MDKRARSLRADTQAGTTKQRSKRKLRLRKEEDRGTKKQKASRATTLPFPVTAAEEQARQAESTTAAAKPTTTAAKPATATGSGPATAKRPTAAAIERSAVTKPIWEWQRSKRREERSIPGKERAAKKSATTAWREPLSFAGR